MPVTKQDIYGLSEGVGSGIGMLLTFVLQRLQQQKEQQEFEKVAAQFPNRPAQITGKMDFSPENALQPVKLQFTEGGVDNEGLMKALLPLLARSKPNEPARAYFGAQKAYQELSDPLGMRKFKAQEDYRTKKNIEQWQATQKPPQPKGTPRYYKDAQGVIKFGMPPETGTTPYEAEKGDENLRFSEYDDPETGERVRISYDPQTGKETGREKVGKSPLTSDIKNRKAALERVNPILDGISELSEKINTGQGVVAKLSGGIERVQARINLNDDIAEYEALISGFTPMVARALGHTGVLTEQDVQSVKEMFPKAGDSKTLRDRKINRIKKLLGAMSGETTGGEPTSTGDKIKVW